MMKSMRLVLVFMLLLCAVAVTAQDDEIPDAEIANDDGGVRVLTGELSYSDPTLGTYGTEPVVILASLDTLLDPDFEYYYATEYVDTDEPQYMGAITSDINVSPFTYELYLPAEPDNGLVDVDNDDEDDTGVMIFNVNFTFDGFGSPFIDLQDFTYYESTIPGDQYENFLEIIGGTMVIYSPDDEQGFPSGYGDDGVIFTEDDPIVRIPQGWTVVNLDDEEFTFDRSHTATVDIIEPEGEASPDFSSLSYTEAFDAMIAHMRTNYAFSEFKSVDWDVLVEEYRPLFEEAEENEDSATYQIALNTFVENAIPDGHVGISSEFLGTLGLPEDIVGGLGIALQELSDGRVIVIYVGDDTPAEEEGIEVGAEVTEINGTPIDEAIAAEPGLNPPYSSEILKRLEQVRGVVRFTVGEDVDLTYQNPGDDDPTTATLTAVDESASRLVSRSTVYGEPRDYPLPIEFRILDSGYGYIAIYSFFDSHSVATELWRYAINYMNQQGVPGLIIDMRYNGGGSTAQYVPMGGYFFDERQVIGNSGSYVEDRDEFYFDPRTAEQIIPAPEAERYNGEVAVIISPACFSACEFFSQMLTTDERAQIVGHYPTGGLGGSIDYFYMPEGVLMQFTTGRAVDAEGEIHIEGSGVEPTVEVPVTEETVFSEEDVLLDAAVAALDSALAPEAIDGGEIAVGDSVDGEIEAGTRVSYTLEVEEDATLNITLGDETGEFDTVLRIYDEDGLTVAENDDSPAGDTYNSLVEGLEVEAGDVLIIEVATFDDAFDGEYTLTVEAVE
jgi:C-terminal processing protease CtpA/Prc